MFSNPEHVAEVHLTTEEVTRCARCRPSRISPLSRSPTSRTGWCVETKSLKLYLWGFRQRPVFAEALAAEIAGEIMTTAQPRRVTVKLRQRLHRRDRRRGDC